MREIEFRGKRKFDNTWIYGGYMKTARTNKIQIGGTSRFCTVYPETLGQYAGLKDKNGTKIFEGDIVKDEFGRIMKVIFKDNWGKFQFELIKITGYKWTNNFRFADLTDWFNGSLSETPEIIGNIYDNPELVEIKQNENN